MLDISQYTTVPYQIIKTNLISEEGECLLPYRCSAGKLTIGIGHNLQAKQTDDIIGRPISKDGRITYSESDMIFRYDLKQVLEQLTILPYWSSLSPAQQYVLVSMNFNLGFAGLLKFKQMLKGFSTNNKEQIIREMRDSKWSKDVRSRALKLINIIERDAI